MVIKPDAIPQFSGDLGAVESHAAALTSAGGAFRTTGQNVHSTWQGLSAFYEAPEAARLFGVTVPVKTGAEAVGGDIEEVGAALAQYAATVRPIANRLTQLRGEAGSFVAGINGDDDWREDGDKVNRNNELIRQVDTQVAALMAAERETANRINRLYGGTQWSVNDGSEKPNAYGFDAGQLPGDADRPWGSSEEKDEPWYTDTWNAVWSGGKGLIVDGLWGDITGLWGLINVFDWDTFSSSWGGLWTLTGGLVFDTENSLNTWKEFGKSLLAWDQWSTDPARAFGNVLYNVVTLPLAAAKIGTLGKAGKGAAAGADAGRAADAARAGDVAGDVGRVADAGRLTDDFGRVADVGRADQLPTVGDLARQIDAALGDVVKADPALELALRQADDIAVSAERAKPGDDLVGRGGQPPVRVEEPALVGAGRGAPPADLPPATGHHPPPTGGHGGSHDLPPTGGHSGGHGDIGRGDDAGDVGRGADDTSRGRDDAPGGDSADGAGRGTGDAEPPRYGDTSLDDLDRADGPGGGELDPMGRRSDWTDPAAHPQPPSRPPDGHLPAGDPVYHRPGGTAIGYDSSTMRNFDAVAPEPGYHDVVVHGERSGLFRPGLVGADGGNYPANHTHPAQIADAVRNNPHYDGGPVRLVSCHTGTVDIDAGVPPAAQQVADALGVPVMAPTNAVGVSTHGPAGQIPRIRDGGQWVTFYPGGGR